MKILVTGARSQIGHFLLPLLTRQGHRCLCLSRRNFSDTQEIRWIKGDLKDDLGAMWQECRLDVWIHLAFLDLAIPHLEFAAKSGVKQFIGFSSTSVLTKKMSESSEERQLIQQLLAAETQMQSICQAYEVAWTLFRPTMIYGCGLDQNIAFIRKVIERFGFFPVAGQGEGLRQPVHAEDLALACIAVVAHDKALNKTYILSGGEVLTYREMVVRTFVALNRKPRIVAVHPVIYKYAVVVIRSLFPRYAFVQVAMIDRMNKDMAFDYSEAVNDFSYHPRPFQP